MWFKTTRVLLTAGAATGGTSLNAFDNALRVAGIADFNLIKVTSIVPPTTPVSHRPASLILAGEGMMLPAVYETRSSRRTGSKITAAVGVGVPPPEVRGAGMIFVYAGAGSKRRAERIVRQMVDEGMHNKGYALHRFEVAAAEIVVKRDWSSVFAAACFCDRDIEKLLPGTRSTE